MARQSEQLEHEAEIARAQLANSLDELRLRLTPGEIVDEVVEYARDTPAADFARNLARDVRQSPLPLLVILAGIVWAVIASAIAQSRATARKSVNTGMVPDAHTARTPAGEEWRVMPVDQLVK